MKIRERSENFLFQGVRKFSFDTSLYTMVKEGGNPVMRVHSGRVESILLYIGGGGKVPSVEGVSPLCEGINKIELYRGRCSPLAPPMLPHYGKPCDCPIVSRVSIYALN